MGGCGTDRRIAAAQGGFTLIELSVVLVVIAIMAGITVVGIDVYRNAVGVRIYSDFVQSWQGAFNTYLTRSGGVLPGDDPLNPSGYVNQALDTPICDGTGALALSTAMLQYGVTLPVGRGPGMAARYVYQDKSGLPHQLTVCLVTTMWSVATVQPGATTIQYTPTVKTVLRIQGLTPDLATQLGSMIDGRIDAGLGNLRQQQYDSAGQSMSWSMNATQDINGGTNAEQQSGELTADLVLD